MSIGGPQGSTGWNAKRGFDLLPVTTKGPKRELGIPKETAPKKPEKDYAEATVHHPYDNGDGVLRIGGREITIPTKFEKFNPRMMNMFLTKKGFAGIIYGRRGTGKTTLLKDLVYQNRKLWDKVYLFSRTATLQDDNYYFIPTHHKYENYDENILGQIFEEQKKDVEMKKKNKQEKAIDNVLILFDDIISEEKIRHSQTFNSLFTVGRHYYITPIVLTQSIGGQNGIPKVVRDNVDLVIGFAAHNQVDRELISERYLSQHHKKVGEEIYKQITNEPYVALAAVVGKPEIRMYEDFVYSYRAPEITPKFIIGHELEKDPKQNPLGIDKTLKIPSIDLPHSDGVLIRF